MDPGFRRDDSFEGEPLVAGLPHRVRRAGLDLDPGYVPWLGCVVRFLYE